MNEADVKLLRVAINVAAQARAHGNHPFGAILVDGQGEVLLAAENSVVTYKDATGHAETNLIRAATPKYDEELLGRCTLYSSAEPCPMCAGAIVWGGVRRVVYGLGLDGIYAQMGGGEQTGGPNLRLASRVVFESAGWPIEVIGPMLEEEARVVHEGFWK